MIRAKAMNWYVHRGQLHYRARKFPITISKGVSYSEAEGRGGTINLNLEHVDEKRRDRNDEPERRSLYIELDEHAAVMLVAELQSALQWCADQRFVGIADALPAGPRLHQTFREATELIQAFVARGLDNITIIRGYEAQGWQLINDLTGEMVDRDKLRGFIKLTCAKARGGGGSACSHTQGHNSNGKCRGCGLQVLT